ncbi:MAG: peptidylprolyl isomerase [Bacilli bacterium]|nr:peptidylprolyl isomerase [Bacilli bacterium]
MANEKNASKNKLGINKMSIICAVVGLVVGLGIMALFIPERIAETKKGEQIVVEVGKENITADGLYTKLKENSGLTVLLQEIDKTILNKKYKLTDDQKEEVEKQAKNYFDMYKQYYGYTEKQFLEANNFDDKNAFIEYLQYQYRTNLYYQEYLESKITDDDIKDYYDKNVYGDVKTKYIAVAKTSDDETANKKEKELADEILKKINKGTSYDDIVKEYKDKITSKDLDYVAWNSTDVDSTYLTKLKDMKDKTNSKVVETSYGYTIIFREGSKDKAKLKDAKKDVIEAIKNKMNSEDDNLYNKAFIKLREDNKVKFYDTELQKEYKDFCKQFE